MTINNFVLIIGAMKCGTTSLFNYLAEHPQIAPCKSKEPCFFSKNDNWKKGFEWYQQLWDWDSSKHKIALEASTSYTRIPSYLNAAERIAKVNSQFKFIYIMRDPLERIKSHYIYSKINRFVETQGKTSEEINWRIIEATKYYKQISEYYQRFPTENILLLNFNLLEQNPAYLLREICLFLDIDPEYQFKVSKVHNASKELIVSSPVWHLMRKNELLRSGVRRLIPHKQKKVLRTMLGNKFKEKVEFSLSQKQNILKELKLDLVKLESHYNFDISDWQM